MSEKAERRAKIVRKTKETRITVEIEFDGTGRAEVSSGIGFFDHMLTHLARHSLFDLKVTATGDLEIDAHHTVEDVGICLGKAFAKAVGDGKGLTRYGHAVVPMDEALAEATVDISGRPFHVFQAELPGGRVGEFDLELTEEFFRAFAMNSRCTMHLQLRYGTNAHHCVQGLFKAMARALGIATRQDPRGEGGPSTKGSLDTDPT
jgi:imidazoleglycerol-phosphate dehydratase